MNEVALLKERLALSRDTIATQGWRYMHEGWEEELANIKATTLSHCNEEKDLWFRKGAASVLERLVKLEEYLDAIEAAIAQASEQEPEE